MKTAMTEWFDELKTNYPYMANEIFEKGFNKYLQKEKENIIKAYKEGWKQGANFSADPELYFTSNYLSNEEKSL